MKQSLVCPIKKASNSNNFHEECRLQMSDNGISFSGDIRADGMIHRFSADNNPAKKDEWYCAHEWKSTNDKLFLSVAYGSWSTGETFYYKSWESDEEYALSREERKEAHREWRLLRDKIEKERIEQANSVAKTAESLWESSASFFSGNFGYLSIKGVDSVGIKFCDHNGTQALTIPLYNIAGELRTLQFIFWYEKEKKFVKRFLPGGEKRGNFYMINDHEIGSSEKIFVVEGWATGKSVYEALDGNIPVVMAVDSNNLLPVIQNIREKYPDIAITIAGDLDDNNCGQLAAKETARTFGCSVVLPKFPDNNDRLTDFNDLHFVFGIEKVKEQLAESSLIGYGPSVLTKDSYSELQNPCADFFVDRLPSVLSRYIAVISEHTEAHPIMTTCSVLAMISGFLGTKVFIEKGDYFQRLYTNVWLLCISDSGNFKTTALNNGASIALRDNAEINRQIKELQKEEKGCFGKEEKQKLLDKILELSTKSIILPNKLTGESLTELLSQGHQGTIYASEFGAFLQNLDKSHNTDFKAILTDWYDVPQSWKYTTKTQGSFILERPYVSLCGVSTLAWLKKCFQESDVSGGFYARFLFFMPQDSYKVPDALPKSLHSDMLDAERIFRNNLYAVLDTIGDCRRFFISSGAKNLFSSSMGYHQQIHQLGKKEESLSLDPFIRRWSPYLLKLSMIMQLFIDPETDEISPEAMHIAMSILRPAINSTKALFKGELVEGEFEGSLRKILNYIKNKTTVYGKATRTHIIKSKIIDGSTEKYDIALTTLVERGEIIAHTKSKKTSWWYEPVA